MRAKSARAEPTRAARIIIADTALGTRNRLVECRLAVDPNLNELVTKRRGAAAARSLTLLADETVRAVGPHEAKQRLAEMCARLIDARLAS